MCPYTGFTTEASDSVNSSLIIILILSGIILIFSILLILYVIKRKCVAKKISDKDLRYQEPTYEEVTRHKEIQMEGNAAYGHVIH